MRFFLYTLITALTLSFSACGNADGTVDVNTITPAGGGTAASKLVSIEVVRADAYKTFTTDKGGILIQGTNLQAHAIGAYADGTSKDITNSVVWSKSNNNIDVTQTGLVTGVAVGTSSALATSSGVVGQADGEVVSAVLERLTVFGDNESPVGRDIQLDAQVVFNVDIVVDVTESNDTVWSSSDTNVTVSATGLVSSDQNDSRATITATYTHNGVSKSATHSVHFTPAVIDHLQIQKNGGTSCEGEVINDDKQTLELVDNVSYPPNLSPNAFYPIVCAVYTNGFKEYVNQSAIWWSDNQEVAQVDYRKGSFVFGVDLGTDVTIFAKYDGLEASFPVDVIAQSDKTLDSIYITNTWDANATKITSKTIEVGDKTPLVAYGNYTYSDGSNGVEYINANVTWTSADLSTVWIWDVISSYIHGLQVSTAPVAVTATWQGKSSSVAVTVNTTSAYNSIEIQKGYNKDGNGEELNATKPLVISQGQVQYITAWGVKADGSKVYINKDVVWRSADNAIASMDIAQRNSNVTGVAVGNTDVNATAGGYTGTTPVNVLKTDGILASNIRWGKDVIVNDTNATGKTARDGHIPVLDPSTAVWYFLRAGQGYTKGTTIDKINLSFAATLEGSTSDVYVNVYMYDTAGNKVKSDIIQDSDWTDYQAANPSYVIRTDYYERSEKEVVQCNFVLRLGSSTYQGHNKDFTIDKFVVTTTP